MASEVGSKSKNAIPQNRRLKLLARNERFRKKLDDLRELRDRLGPDSRDFLRLMFEITDEVGLSCHADDLLDDPQFQVNQSDHSLFPLIQIIPQYEPAHENLINGYYCNDCGKEFRVKLRITEGEPPRPAEEKILCPNPKCNSEKTTIQQRHFWRPVFVKDGFLHLRMDFSRYSIREITAAIEAQYLDLQSQGILPDMRKKRRPKRVAKYDQYLEVWDRRHQDPRPNADEVAQAVWPKEYKEIGKIIYPDKNPLHQRVYEYEEQAQKDIDNAYPAPKATR